MTTQTLTTSAMIFDLVVALPSADFLAEPVRASSRDYGFDFDQEELAEELLAPLPASLVSQTTSKVSAEEFEFHCLSLF